MKLMNMSDYNGASRLYWVVMVAAGALTSLWGLHRCLAFTSSQGAQFLGLIALVVAASSYPIRIPNTNANVTVSDTFVFLGAILLGVPAAVVLGLTDSLIGSLRTTRRASSWLVASAMMSVTVFAASSAFYYALTAYAGVTREPLGIAPLPMAQVLVPLLVMTLVQYWLNCWLFAALYALKHQGSVWRCWREGYMWTSWTFFAAAIAALLIYEAIANFGLLQAALGIAVLAATYATYKVYFERIHAQTRETTEISRLHLATVEALAAAIDAKDQTTHCHVQRVQVYATGVGRLLRLPPNEIEALRAGALLHDIGKLAVPDNILNKPGQLSVAEFEKIKIHTTVGAQILERVGYSREVTAIVRHHHEQWNGEGYPDGLSDEAIPLTARVLAVVDCFDTVREDRPYRSGMTAEEAGKLLRRGAGIHFDPRVVEMFLNHLPEFERQIEMLDLNQRGFTTEECDARLLIEANTQPGENRIAPLTPPSYLCHIESAYREVHELYEMARTFGLSLDVDETSTVLVNKVKRIVPYDTCAVYLYDELSGRARAAKVAGRNADAIRNLCIVPGEGIVGGVLTSRRQIMESNQVTDFAAVRLATGDVYRSMMAVPLAKDGRLLGVLAVYCFEPGRHTSDHMRMLDTAARLASDALANALRHAEIESNALTDLLTALPNARALYIRFEEEAARARRTARSLHVIMLDLDEFKMVNDTFGHKTGDQLLREMAIALQAQLRDYDFLARYAGDEFVAVVQDLTTAQVDELCTRIEAAVGQFSLHIRLDEYARVGISVGAATYRVDGETLDQLLVCADQAMYAAKSDHKKQRRNQSNRFTTANRD